jgi:hypothetical protein
MESKFSLIIQKSIPIDKFPLKYFICIPFLKEFSTLKNITILKKANNN